MLEFYHEKFESIRKGKGITASKLCSLAGISRVSYWKWKKGTQVPKETTIRVLAETLGLSVSEISNLTDSHPVSDMNFQRKYNSWESLSKGNSKAEYKKKIADSLKTFLDLNEKLENTQLLIDAILTSIGSMIYLKDKNLNYIIANDKFLNNASLNGDYSIYKKNDMDIFPKNEANGNTKDDESVLLTGQILQKEGYIPGSRKKKWGLITKSPVFDARNKIAGIVGNMIDLTEKKEIEARNALLEKIISKADECVCIGKSDKIIYVNIAFEKMTGLKTEDFIKNPSMWLSLVHPDDMEKVEKTSQMETYPKEVTFRIIRKTDNAVRLISEKYYVENDVYFGILKDITNEKNLYE